MGGQLCGSQKSRSGNPVMVPPPYAVNQQTGPAGPGIQVGPVGQMNQGPGPVQVAMSPISNVSPVVQMNPVGTVGPTPLGIMKVGEVPEVPLGVSTGLDSFLVERVPSESFVVHGLGFRGAGSSALRELGARNDLRIAAGPNEQMIFTTDNRDLKTIAFGEIFEGFPSKGGATQLFAVRPVPEFVRSRVRRLAGPRGKLDTSNGNFRLLDTAFNLEEEYREDERAFLFASSKLDSSARVYPPWDADEFELRGSNRARADALTASDLDLALRKAAAHAGAEPGGVSRGGGVLVGVSTGPDSLNLEAARGLPSFCAVMLALLHYERDFKVSILRRVLFPEVDGESATTSSGLAVVKLLANGCRRAFFVRPTPAGLARTRELFPEALASALGKLYGPGLEAPAPALVFRILGWIPDRVTLADTGPAEASFEKLKASFLLGNLLIFFSEAGGVRPILGFHTDGFGLSKKMFVTTLGEAGAGLDVRAWEPLYTAQRLSQLHVCWNPTIYSHRKTVHFRAPADPMATTRGFGAARAAQLVLTVAPHAQELESRFVFEKHRKARNEKMRFRVLLTQFAGFRASVVPAPTRVLEGPDFDDLFADILVFGNNAAEENYLLIVFLEPENKDDLTRSQTPQIENVSLSFHCFGEFDLVELPYTRCLQQSNLRLALGRLPRSEDPVVQSGLLADSAPAAQLVVRRAASFEFRVSEGAPGVFYSFYLFKGTASGPLSRADVKSEAPEQAPCSFAVNLAEGNFVLKVAACSGSREPSYPAALATPPHEFELKTLAFGTDLSRDPVVLEPPSGQTSIFELRKAEAAVLGHRRVINGSFGPENNAGIVRSKVGCYQKFLKNPGALFSVGEETELTVSLSAHQPGREPAMKSLFLARIEDDFTFSILREDETYQPSNSLTLGPLRLKPNRYGFLLLVVALKETASFEYELEFKSSAPLLELRDNSASPLRFEANDRLSATMPAGSGGPSSLPTFLANHAAIISFLQPPSKRETILAELLTPASQLPVSLYLIPTKKTNLYDLTREELSSGFANMAFLREFNSVFTSDAVNQQYLIVPTSITPTQTAHPFELRVQASVPFKLDKLPPINFGDQSFLKVVDTDWAKIDLPVLKSTKGIITITPDPQKVELEFILSSGDSQLLRIVDSIEDSFFIHRFAFEPSPKPITMMVRFNRRCNVEINVLCTVKGAIAFKKTSF